MHAQENESFSSQSTLILSQVDESNSKAASKKRTHVEMEKEAEEILPFSNITNMQMTTRSQKRLKKH